MMELIEAGSNEVAALSGMTVQQLREELARALTVSARHLAYLAQVWKELEVRGEDLSDLRTGLAAYLPMIASGRVDAEAVVQFAGNGMILRSIALLPLEEQRRLATGGTVTVLSLDEKGQSIEQTIPATAMTASHARVVFGEGRIRAPAEQRALIESAWLRSTRRRTKTQSRVIGNPKTGKIKIGRTEVTIGEIMGAIADLAGDVRAIQGEDTPNPKALIELQSAEHRALKIHAAESGKSIQETARAALWAAGLLSE